MGDADDSYERDWNKFLIDGREKKRTRANTVQRKKRSENERQWPNECDTFYKKKPFIHASTSNAD